MVYRPAQVYNGSGWDDIGDKRIGAESGDIPQASVTDLTSDLASKVPYSYGTAEPTTSVDGFVWFDENDTPPTPKFWDGAAFQNVASAGGLELITAETFSAVSSVSINNCFTAAYQNYFVLVSSTCSTTADMQLRMRLSGTDNSNNEYTYGRIYVGMTTTQALGHTTNTTASIHTIGSCNTAINTAEIIIGSPKETANTTISSRLAGRWFDFNGTRMTVTTAYDGLSIFPASGTFTGTIRVYGYKD